MLNSIQFNHSNHINFHLNKLFQLKKALVNQKLQVQTNKSFRKQLESFIL